MLTHDCTPSNKSNLFIKFADDTTVVGLISNRDETNYRSEVSRLAGWCMGGNPGGGGGYKTPPAEGCPP